MTHPALTAALSRAWHVYEAARVRAREVNTVEARLALTNAEHNLAERLDAAGVCLLVSIAGDPACVYHTGTRVRVRPVVVAGEGA